MVAAPSELLEVIEKLPIGSTLFLNDVGWEDYEELLEQLEAEKRRLRIAYDQGRLEVMTLTIEHEGYKSLFAHLLAVLALELKFKLRGSGSVTLKLEKAKRGAEPDDSYYIQHIEQSRGLKRINLETDPPPDLVVEVDITSPSLKRLPIYASLGVPELWIFDGGLVTIYQLVDGNYHGQTCSAPFPFLSAEVITQHIHLGATEDITEMITAFREWVVAHKPQVGQ